MPPVKIKWSSLLHLTELDFIPEQPKVLSVSDELIQALSWLTGATKHDRRLLRCDENGALLVADAWSLLNSVDTDELFPQATTPDTYTPAVTHKGILVATSTEIVKLSFLPVLNGVSEHVYISPNTLYWHPRSVYTVTATVVPAATGSASYVGITAFN